MIKLTDCIISNKTLGSKILLTDVIPIWAYENGKRTNSIVGYRYVVVLPALGFEKLGIRIDGQQLLDAPSECMEVAFENLELFIFWLNGSYQLGARATNVRPVKVSA